MTITKKSLIGNTPTAKATPKSASPAMKLQAAKMQTAKLAKMAKLAKLAKMAKMV